MNKQIKNKKGQVLVELKNVRKEYGQKDKKIVAIEDLSFKITEGENIFVSWCQWSRKNYSCRNDYEN